MKSGIVLTAKHELTAKRALYRYATSGEASHANRCKSLRTLIDRRLGVTSAGMSRDRLELTPGQAGLLYCALQYCANPQLYHDPHERVPYSDLYYDLFGSARLATAHYARR